MSPKKLCLESYVVNCSVHFCLYKFHVESHLSIYHLTVTICTSQHLETALFLPSRLLFVHAELLFVIHLCNMALWVIYSGYKTPSLSRQQDIQLRNVAGITAAADFSRLARSCSIAAKLSEHCHRAEWSHYTFSLSITPVWWKKGWDHQSSTESCCTDSPKQTQKWISAPLWEVFDICSQLCRREELLPSCLSTGSCSLIEKYWDKDFYFDSQFMNNPYITLWITK